MTNTGPRRLPPSIEHAHGRSPLDPWHLFTCASCTRSFLTQLDGRINLCLDCAPLTRLPNGTLAYLRHSSLCTLNRLRNGFQPPTSH